jgi:hypothetical protein
MPTTKTIWHHLPPQVQETLLELLHPKANWWMPLGAPSKPQNTKANLPQTLPYLKML